MCAGMAKTELKWAGKDIWTMTGSHDGYVDESACIDTDLGEVYGALSLLPDERYWRYLLDGSANGFTE